LAFLTEHHDVLGGACILKFSSVKYGFSGTPFLYLGTFQQNLGFFGLLPVLRQMFENPEKLCYGDFE
jgi:hypothetical protein